MRGPDRQQQVYLGGVAGKRPLVPTDAEALEARAQEEITPEAFAYVAGGAGTGRTIKANRNGFDAWRIVPRVLRDVSARDTSIELFGRRHPSPFLMSPVGVCELVHDDADARPPPGRPA